MLNRALQFFSSPAAKTVLSTETTRGYTERVKDIGMDTSNAEFPSVFCDSISTFLMDDPVMIDLKPTQILDESTIKQCIRDTGSFKNPFTNYISGKASYTEVKSLKTRIEKYVTLLERTHTLLNQLDTYLGDIDDMSALFEGNQLLLQHHIEEQKRARIKLILEIKFSLINTLMELGNLITGSLDLDLDRQKKEKEDEKVSLLKGINLLVNLLCVECAHINAIPENFLTERFQVAIERFCYYKQLAFNSVKPWLEAAVLARLIRLSEKVDNTTDLLIQQAVLLTSQPQAALPVTAWMTLFRASASQQPAPEQADFPTPPMPGID